MSAFATVGKTLRLHVRKGLGEPTSNEELVYCDLSDKDTVEALVEECDGIVHMGGQATELPETIRAANIDGMVNLYEAARKSSVSRASFASSIM